MPYSAGNMLSDSRQLSAIFQRCPMSNMSLLWIPIHNCLATVRASWSAPWHTHLINLVLIQISYASLQAMAFCNPVWRLVYLGRVFHVMRNYAVKSPVLIPIPDRYQMYIRMCLLKVHISVKVFTMWMRLSKH